MIADFRTIYYTLIRFLKYNDRLFHPLVSIATARYSVPSHWNIGKIYNGLILGIDLSLRRQLLHIHHHLLHRKLIHPDIQNQQYKQIK